MQATCDIVKLKEVAPNGGAAAAFLLPAVDSQLKRTFGGQVVAQTLAAARQTVTDDRLVLSLHGYFIGPGDSSRDLRADVEILRDGGTFSSRRVIVTQDARTVFLMTANFAADGQTGPHHQAAMPAVPSPDSLKEKDSQFPPGVMLRDWQGWDLRPLPEDTFFGPNRGAWLRYPPASNEPAPVQRELVGYMSDMMLPYVALKEHPDNMNENLSRQIASLDHGVWFYGDIDVSQWMYYHQYSPVAGAGSGLNIGTLYSEAGDVLAVVTQQTMMRDRR